MILRRMDRSIIFHKRGAQYKASTWYMVGGFFLGFEKIYAISNGRPQELYVLLEDFEGVVRFEAFNTFAMGDKLELYKLNALGMVTGASGDSLIYHRRMYFRRSRQR